jgi:hypothetical protein
MQRSRKWMFSGDPWQNKKTPMPKAAITFPRDNLRFIQEVDNE